MSLAPRETSSLPYHRETNKNYKRTRRRRRATRGTSFEAKEVPRWARPRPTLLNNLLMALSFAGNDFIRREVHPSHGGAGTLCAHHQIHIHLGWGRSRAHEQSLILLDAAHNGPAGTTAMPPRRRLRRREFAVFRGTRLLVCSPTSAKEDKKSGEGWSSAFRKCGWARSYPDITHVCVHLKSLSCTSFEVKDI